MRRRMHKSENALLRRELHLERVAPRRAGLWSVRRTVLKWGRGTLVRLVMSLGLVLLLFSGYASADAAASASAPRAVENAELQNRGGDTPAASSLLMPAPPSDYTQYDGGWIKIAYHPSLAARVQVLRDDAEKVRSDLQALLGRPVLDKVHVRIGRTAGEMETLAPPGVDLPRYASGVAFSELDLVLLTAAPRYPGSQHDLSEVFRHELAHIALHDAVSRENIPRWFNEGFAVHASREAETARMQALWTATLSGNLIPFKQITRSFPADPTTASVAYAQAADMLRFLMRGGEEHRFQALIRRVAGGETFEQALLDAYSTDMFSLEKGWREDVARRYTFWPVLFGGSLIWIVGFGLLIWGYARRKKRAALKMARWAREEAIEDAQRRWAQALLQGSARVRVVVTDADSASKAGLLPEGARQANVVLHQPVPSIEHEGQRYTLH